MGFITENNNWEDDIYEIETSDQLLGGTGGPLNKAAQNLANRTQYLRKIAQGFEEITLLNATHTLTMEELLHKLIIIDANNAALTITLPDSNIDTIAYGTRSVITAINVNNNQVKVLRAGTDVIIDGGTKNEIYLGDGDEVEIIFTSAGWLFRPLRGNFDTVGDVELQYKQKRNTIIADGTAYNRAKYPRLWEYVQTLGSSLVSDTTWLSSPGQKGYYSTGNGTTTFRVPDLRAMFLRGLDLGAGIDTGRYGNNPGSFEMDELKQHSHSLSYSGPKVGVDYGSGSARSSWTEEQTNVTTTGSNGGSETRPKNIGLIPLIKV